MTAMQIVNLIESGKLGPGSVLVDPKYGIRFELVDSTHLTIVDGDHVKHWVKKEPGG